MKKLLRNYKFWLVLILLTAVSGYMFARYRANRFDILDKAAFNDFKKNFEAASEAGFESQEQLSSFITSWADSNSIKYKIDSAGNIIFNTPAIDRKKDVSPTLVIVGMNYKTAQDKASLFASAAMIAMADLESSKKVVIFANDELSSGKGYSNLSKKLISSKAKIIYMDQGDQSYLSTQSYAETISQIEMPASTEEAALDSAVRISISGVNTAELRPSATASQPDPLAVLSTLLTRLKTKSIDYRLADFNVGSNDNMYPDSIDATILINSYSIESFTKYIDRTVKSWEKDYAKGNPLLTFSYEILENESDMPKTSYDAESTDLFTRMLYTINSGVYLLSASDPIPEGKNKGDPFGLNCIVDVAKSDSSIRFRLVSQACNEMYLNRIVIDNQAAAELLACKFQIAETHDMFANDKDSLLQVVRTTYTNVNSGSEKKQIPTYADDYFTACSYLAEKNSKADIIHLSMSNKAAARLTNTLMFYIKSKGNTFTL